MKVKALLELLADYDPEMEVLLVRACPRDGVASLLPDGQESCREKPLVVPFFAHHGHRPLPEPDGSAWHGRGGVFGHLSR